MIRIGFRFGHRSTIGFDLIDRSVDWLIETVLAISFALIDVPAILQTELSTERFVIVWNPANLWSREQPSVTSDDLWSREELAVNFADLLTRCFFAASAVFRYLRRISIESRIAWFDNAIHPGNWIISHKEILIREQFDLFGALCCRNGSFNKSRKHLRPFLKSGLDHSPHRENLHKSVSLSNCDRILLEKTDAFENLRSRLVCSFLCPFLYPS